MLYDELLERHGDEVSVDRRALVEQELARLPPDARADLERPDAWERMRPAETSTHWSASGS